MNFEALFDRRVKPPWVPVVEYPPVIPEVNNAGAGAIKVNASSNAHIAK